MNTSGTVSTRCLAWKSWMVKLADSGSRVRRRSGRSCVTLPESSAMAEVKLLKVEPISKTPAVIAVQPIRVLSASTGLFGS